MKKFAALLLFALPSLLLLHSCNKKDPDTVAPYAKLSVSFSNEVDGTPVSIGPMSYTNAAGNKYSVSLLKYYISNFTLVKADGSAQAFSNHNLIDAALPASQTFSFDSVANGDYTAVRFNMGVDFEHNHTGAQEGDLDPAKGMIWAWKTGYIFFKHEGDFIDSTGATKSVMFHYGTDFALVTVTVPISKLSISGADRKLFLKFNLNALYANPNRINFNADNNHMSTDAADGPWLTSMGQNFKNAFQFSKAE